MDCPACSAKLTTLMVGDIDVEACQNGCGGIWFDKDELLKFDEPHEFPASPILHLAKEKEGVKVDPNKRKHCPKCSNEPLVRQFLDHENQIEIDQCWNCAGIWFDVGELNAVRAQFETYEDRAQAVKKYSDEIIAQSKAAMAANTSAQIADYNDRVRNLTLAFEELLTGDHPLDV